MYFQHKTAISLVNDALSPEAACSDPYILKYLTFLEVGYRGSHESTHPVFAVQPYQTVPQTVPNPFVFSEVRADSFMHFCSFQYWIAMKGTNHDAQ